MLAFAFFPTAIGTCALVWNERGVVALQWPEANEAASRARLARRHPQAREMPPPAAIAAAIADVTALLAGEPRDLSGIALDLHGVPDFHRRVYEIARRIAPGQTLTYGEIAQQLGGEPGLARAVGQ